MNIVLIPTHNRTAFLTLCLQNIMAAEGASRYLYVFAVDRGCDPQALTIIRRFPHQKIVLRAPNHPFQGGSFNIIEGLRTCADLVNRVDAQYIHVIEDDIMIGRDYFTWHERVQEEFRPIVVSACRNQNTRVDHGSDPEEVYEHVSYQSLGVALRADVLPEIVRHGCEDYYRDPFDYVSRVFPCSAVPLSHCEQAGLIRRVLERHDTPCLYPAVPRAYHAGYYGKNRPVPRPDGSLKERVRALATMTAEEMNERAAGTHQDITPCDLSGHHINRVRLAI
jgi:hypothetical protein